MAHQLLTENAIHQILVERKFSLQPVLQVFEIKQLRQGYFLALNDGQNWVKTKVMDQLIQTQGIIEYSIIRLNQYCLQNQQNHTIIITLEVEVVIQIYQEMIGKPQKNQQTIPQNQAPNFQQQIFLQTIPQNQIPNSQQQSYSRISKTLIKFILRSN
jgi:hypothetical protein